MLRPAMATLRPWRPATCTTCWMREMREANVAMMILPGAWLTISSRAS